MVESAVRIPLTPATAEINNNVMSQMMEEIAYGQTEPEEGLQWASDEAQALLDEAWADIW
jgi:hypothetical protein